MSAHRTQGSSGAAGAASWTAAPRVVVVAALSLCASAGCGPRYLTGLPPPGPRVVDLALGLDHSCALREDGSVWCWGDNSRGQRGLGDRRSPRKPTPAHMAGAVQIAAGHHYTCALLKEGTVSCWGDNSNGQIGLGRGFQDLVPGPVPGLSGVVQLAAGAVRLCALLSTGEVVCRGRMPPDKPDDPDPPPPCRASLSCVETLPDLGHPRAIAGRGGHFCALGPSSLIQCWRYAQETKKRLDAGSVSSSTAVSRIAVGSLHACALLAGGSVQCWDAAFKGSVAKPSTPQTARPFPIEDLPPATALTAGTVHACALLADTTVGCWGANDAGQLGRGSEPLYAPFALRVAELRGIQKIVAGYEHTCALRDDGAVLCWGNDERFQIGADPKLDYLHHSYRVHPFPKAVVW